MPRLGGERSDQEMTTSAVQRDHGSGHDEIARRRRGSRPGRGRCPSPGERVGFPSRGAAAARPAPGRFPRCARVRALGRAEGGHRARRAAGRRRVSGIGWPRAWRAVARASCRTARARPALPQLLPSAAAGAVPAVRPDPSGARQDGRRAAVLDVLFSSAAVPDVQDLRPGRTGQGPAPGRQRRLRVVLPAAGTP